MLSLFTPELLGAAFMNPRQEDPPPPRRLVIPFICSMDGLLRAYLGSGMWLMSLERPLCGLPGRHGQFKPSQMAFELGRKEWGHEVMGASKTILVSL